MGVLNVGILGAGVVGLNTALELQREFPTGRFTVVADDFGRDTTSEVAAGLFRPSNSFAGPTPHVTNQGMGVPNVAILGAGIVGLHTALELQRQFPTARYTIVADRFDRDTTSEIAAGIFWPSNDFQGRSLHITNKWLKDSYEWYDELRQTDQGFEAGVGHTAGFYFSSSNKDLVRSHYMEGLVPVYRAATPEELKRYPGDWKYGSYFTTLVTECTKFLPWAMNKFERNGGKVRKQMLTSFGDVSEEFDIVMNCLGLGAKGLCNDTGLVPVRGQIIRVKAPWHEPFIFADDDTYIIPRSDCVILGGCRHYDSWDMKVSPYDAAMIREKCFSIVPGLAQAPVVEELVGLRPHRMPTRVEGEILEAGYKMLKVVHNYGHGGYGVTSAPGTAKHAVSLFRDMHSAGLGSKL